MNSATQLESIFAKDAPPIRAGAERRVLLVTVSEAGGLDAWLKVGVFTQQEALLLAAIKKDGQDMSIVKPIFGMLLAETHNCAFEQQQQQQQKVLILANIEKECADTSLARLIPDMLLVGVDTNREAFEKLCGCAYDPLQFRGGEWQKIDTTGGVSLGKHTEVLWCLDVAKICQNNNNN